MIFHRSRIKENVSNKVVVDNKELIKVESAKYLGVIIDCKLNWIDHITYVKKISKCIGIMYKARQFLSKRALLDLYYAYIYPYMTYCIEVWGCASQTQLNCIFLLQKNSANNEFFLLLSTYQPFISFYGSSASSKQNIFS